MKKNKLLLTTIVLFILVLFLTGCTDPEDDNTTVTPVPVVTSVNVERFANNPTIEEGKTTILNYHITIRGENIFPVDLRGSDVIIGRRVGNTITPVEGVAICNETVQTVGSSGKPYQMTVTVNVSTGYILVLSVHGVVSNIFSLSVLPILQGNVTITGLPMVGERLTADISGLQGSGNPSYQWERSTANGFELISGATSAGYTLQAVDEGKTIRVSVSRTGFVGEITSEPTPEILQRVPTVEEQIAFLRVMVPFPEVITITTGRPSEQLVTQNLSFAGRSITITLTRGNTGDILSLNGQGSMFTIGSGVTLILKDIDLHGLNNNNNALVAVNNGGTLIMSTGSRIINNTNNASPSMLTNGGGVRVNGIFIMEDGEISGNTVSNFGGGLLVATLGSFNMIGGKISNNSSNIGGGIANYGIFTMNNGYISGNETARFGGGLANAHTGTFTMYGGSISGNNADDSGGGVDIAANGSFTMNGGVISDNSSRFEGGGVNNFGTFNMFKGSISGNSSNDGGGVFNTGIFNKHDGVISGNSSNTYGGGVSNDGAGAIFNFYGGLISNNSAGYYGGGVLNWQSTFNMRGGVISRNHAIGWGGGLANILGIFQISDEIIYGDDTPDKGNTSATHSVLGNAHSPVVYQYGTFSDTGFTVNGTLPITINDTLEVVDGELIRPLGISGNMGRLENSITLQQDDLFLPERRILKEKNSLPEGMTLPERRARNFY